MDKLVAKKVFFVIGEESGDALGADLLIALKNKSQKSGIEIEAVGLAGPAMSALGMTSLFDISEIAVMGISAVLGRLPTIVKRIYNTVAAIERERPDVIILIDSPDFTHAVAKRIRKKLPDTPIINYVCPSVWAWRQGRAKKMTTYVDHVLALLSFEPDILAQLEGPKSTYVGHKLVDEMKDFSLEKPLIADCETVPVLLLLPGSRRSEVSGMIDVFGETVELMRQRGQEFRCIIPAVNHLVVEIRQKTDSWPVKPEIIVGAADKKAAFVKATAALATSGTVSLELALAGIPMVLAYKMDVILRPFIFVFKIWTAALPNLIADYLLVPENINYLVRPSRLARQVERLLSDTPERRAQVEGMKFVKSKMQTDQPPGEKAADVVLGYLK